MTTCEAAHANAASAPDQQFFRALNRVVAPAVRAGLATPWPAQARLSSRRPAARPACPARSPCSATASATPSS